MSDTPAAESVIVVIYSEIALKGRNRHIFLRRLLNNMRHVLAGEPVAAIDHVSSRLLVRVGDPERIDTVVEKLRSVFGIQRLFVATPVPRSEPEADLKAVAEVAGRLAKRDQGDARNFKVETKRSNKNFPLNSPQISGTIGEAIQPALDLPVKLARPDFTVYLLVLDEHFLVYTARIPGPSGLPAWSSGRVEVLLSGGIDSPVAAWLMMRRGCRPDLTHFFAGRDVAEADTDKIIRIVSVLASFAPAPLRLNLVPVVPYEERAIGKVEDSFDMVMFRRFMFRTTEALARRHHCLALVSGDSLGQVASQTLPNLSAIGPDLRLPVFRPLIGMDKIQITNLAKKAGTYELSIEPYRDCCSIRSPRPILNARAEQLLKRSEAMDLDAAIAESVATSHRLTIGPDGVCA